jgi:hypothetical protein
VETKQKPSSKSILAVSLDIQMLRAMVGTLHDPGINLRADVNDGCKSIAIGEAITKSITQKKAINILQNN